MRYVMHEAGGGAARSAYFFLKDAGIYESDMLAVDTDSRTHLEWQLLLNVNTSSQQDYAIMPADIIVPTDEFYRTNHVGDGTLCMPSAHDIHHKSICYDRLQGAAIKTVKLPKRVKETDGINMFVSRKVLSAGKKGLEISRSKRSENDFTIITEYIPFESEVIIDFYNIVSGIAIAPRISHCINRSGSDTFCTLIGKENMIYEQLLDICSGIVDALRIRNIGHIQLGIYGDNFYFIEAATRLSGSSYLNLVSEFNPIKGILTQSLEHDDNYSAKFVSTKFNSPMFAQNPGSSDLLLSPNYILGTAS